MRRLATLTAAAALALAFGFAGTAWAQTQLLVNPGAETEDMTGWSNSSNVDSVTVVDQSAPDAFPKAGARFFTFTISSEAAAGGPPTSMDQDVDVSGCNIDELGLRGQFSAGGFVQTEELDEGILDVEFDSSLGKFTVDPIAFPQNGGNTYASFGVNGDIPAGAVSANYMITGVLKSGSFINLFLDDLNFTIDCVADFAKISGTKEVGTRGPKRQDPVYTFGGAVGNLESTLLVGTITINYRDIPTSCTFTPTAITYNGDTSVQIDADYVCTNGDEGTAIIDMTAKDADSSCDESDKKGRKNRGSIAVDATTTVDPPFNDDDLDISDSAGVAGDENCLATGNVIIDDGTV